MNFFMESLSGVCKEPGLRVWQIRFPALSLAETNGDFE
jgi:hypothetical protein